MAKEPPITELVQSITDDLQAIVRGEIELAKAEIVPQLQRAGGGAAMLGAAGYLALNAAGLLFISLSIGIGMLFLGSGMGVVPAMALGFGVMALILLVVTGILAAIGVPMVKVAGPVQAKESTQAAVAALKDAVSAGSTKA